MNYSFNIDVFDGSNVSSVSCMYHIFSQICKIHSLLIRCSTKCMLLLFRLDFGIVEMKTTFIFISQTIPIPQAMMIFRGRLSKLLSL